MKSLVLTLCVFGFIGLNNTCFAAAPKNVSSPKVLELKIKGPSNPHTLYFLEQKIAAEKSVKQVAWKNDQTLLVWIQRGVPFSEARIKKLVSETQYTFLALKSVESPSDVLLADQLR